MSPTQADEPIDAVVQQWLEAQRAGKRMECAAILAAHPELAAFQDDYARIDRRFAPLRQLTGATSVSDAATIGAEDTVVPQAPAPGTAFGDYELLAEVARGGMGIVYRARQRSLNRIVALKMVLGGRDARTDRERFLVEARAVARLNHPHLVPIYEVGQHDGLPYFTMEFFTGGSLRERVDQLRRDNRAAARLMSTIARALEHAHRRGILHRDLKPSNVLLDERGEPHIADFGLAKRLDEESDLTQAGAIIGTPSYMAPEQANAQTDLTTAVDVYGLGALLYELLTGRPPFRAATPLETLMAAVSQEPTPPRTLSGDVDPELETICLKCLEKDPLARYGSADALADDLDRWLQGKPIQARPVTIFRKLTKWARRQPLLAGALAAAVLALVGLVVAGGFLWRNAELRAQAVQNLDQAKEQLAQVDVQRKNAERKRTEAETLVDQQRKLAEEQRILAEKIAAEVKRLGEEADLARKQLDAVNVQAQRTLYAADMQLAHAAWQTENMAAVDELLKRHQQPAGFDPRGFEWHYLHRRLHGARLEWNTHQSAKFNPISSLAVSPDGKTLATWDGRPAVMLWNLRDGKLLKSLMIGGGYPSAESLSFADGGRTLVALTHKFSAKETSQVVAAMRRKDPFDPRSLNELLELRTWDLEKGGPAKVTAFDLATAPIPLFSAGTLGVRIQHEGMALRARGVTRSPDGKYVAFAGWPLKIDGESLRATPGGRLLVWDVVKSRVHAVQNAPMGINAVAFSADGKQIAIGNQDGLVGIGTPDLDKPPRLFVGHRGSINYLAFSDDGQRLFSGADDGQIIEWEVASGKEIVRRRGHASPVLQLGLSPDGSTLVSGGQDGSIKVWDRSRSNDPLVLRGHEAFVVSLAFAENGRDLVSVDDDGVVKAWAENGKLLSDGRITARGTLANSLACNGKSIAWREGDDGVVVRGLATGRDAKWNWKTFALALSADNKLVAAGSPHTGGAGLRVWSIGDGKTLATLNEKSYTQYLTFSPNNKLLLAGVGGGVFIWDWQANRSRSILEFDDRFLNTTALTVAADSKVVAVATAGAGPARIRLWDLEKDHLKAEFKGGAHWVRHLSFSPDGGRLAMAGDGAGQPMLKMWDTISGREVFSAVLPPGTITALAFSPDGHRLAAAMLPNDPTAPLEGRKAVGEIHVWDATPQSAAP